MNAMDAIGYVAAILVLATFCMNSMRKLRWVAIASNLAFIAYAVLANLGPVFALHALLLPINVVRLQQLRGAPPSDLQNRNQVA
jgi:CRP/FNR family cyclic AMP-dependent transcriptional regulator